MVAQAAASAILTVVAADGEEGAQRLIDALIGGGVALLFTQLLFSPEPVKLLRGAEAAALRDMAKGLELTAEALERDDDEFGERALTTLRDLRDRLTELSRVRQASGRVARRSAVWRSQRAPVVRENENAGHLDLLGGSCLMLTRAAIATSPPVRRRLAPSVRELADALTRLAREPGDRATRQAAVDRALAVSRDPGGTSVASDAPLAAIMTVRTVAADLMTFAGVDADQAVDAVREGTGEFDIPTPAPAPRTPLRRPGHRF